MRDKEQPDAPKIVIPPITIILIALLALSAAVPARAQQDEAAPAAMDAAVSALNQAIPGIGQPQRFTFSFLTPTTDSALGCPLTQGFDLGRQVTPYRIMLFYPNAQYTYHATEDGAIVIPCDEQLPIGGPLPPGEQPYTPASPIEPVISTFLRSFPERQFPERFEFTFGPPTTDSSLGCPLVDGFTLDNSVVPYRVTLIYEDAQYVYHASEDASILFPCDEQLPIGGPLPTGARPFTPSSPAEAAINAHLDSFPRHGFPGRFTFNFSPPTTDGSLGCPLVDRDPLPAPVVPYVVTLIYDDTSFDYHVSEDGSIIIPCYNR